MKLCRARTYCIPFLPHPPTSPQHCFIAQSWNGKPRHSSGGCDLINKHNRYFLVNQKQQTSLAKNLNLTTGNLVLPQDDVMFFLIHPVPCLSQLLLRRLQGRNSVGCHLQPPRQMALNPIHQIFKKQSIICIHVILVIDRSFPKPM